MFIEGIYSAKSFIVRSHDKEIEGKFDEMDTNKAVAALGDMQKWTLGVNAKTVYKFENGNWFASWSKGFTFSNTNSEEKYTIDGSTLVLHHKKEGRTLLFLKGGKIEQRKAEGLYVFITIFEKDPYVNLKISRYTEKDDAALFDLIRSGGDAWKDYCGTPEAQKKYKAALSNSIVYVCYDGKSLCGFVRARNDDGFGIYIFDLFVHEICRGHSYGRMLIERIGNDFPGSKVYAVSDVDGYYKKLGFQKAGTVFAAQK